VFFFVGSSALPAVTAPVVVGVVVVVVVGVVGVVVVGIVVVAGVVGSGKVESSSMRLVMPCSTMCDQQQEFTLPWLSSLAAATFPPGRKSREMSLMEQEAANLPRSSEARATGRPRPSHGGQGRKSALLGLLVALGLALWKLKGVLLLVRHVAG